LNTSFTNLGYFYHILLGAWMTIQIALSSLVVATILGLITAAMKLSQHAWARRIAYAYSTLIRGVPDLILLMLIFYGGQIFINYIAAFFGHNEYIDVNPFIAGILTLGFNLGAYLSETFRGAIISIPHGQSEAGFAFGMNTYQVFFRITLPQMIRLSIPGYINNWLVLTKTTALISIIGLQDIMFKAKQAGDATLEPFTYLLFAGLMYLLITSVSLWCLHRLEKKYSMGVKIIQI
jgi:arginine/ornithine transport system permease protein